MSLIRIGFSCLVALAFMAVTAPASADVLSPVVAFSVHDEPIDGLGDSFNAGTLIRTQSYRADRAMLEYDISAYAGMTVISATFTGYIWNNNSGGTWPRIFDFSVYDGNGVADLSDYQIASTVVGSLTWPSLEDPSDFDFDAIAELQTLIDGGATHVGFKAVGVSANLFPSLLDENTTLTIEAQAADPCPWDCEDEPDGAVGIDDLVAVINHWGACADPGDCPWDCEDEPDGAVGIDDLVAVINHWGACP